MVRRKRHQLLKMGKTKTRRRDRMKVFDLNKRKPVEEEIRQQVKKNIDLKMVNPLRIENAKYGVLNVFIDKTETEYQFNERAHKEKISTMSPVEKGDLTIEHEKDKMDMETIAKKEADTQIAKEVIIESVIDKLMEVIEEREFQVPITGIDEETEEQVVIGERTSTFDKIGFGELER